MTFRWPKDHHMDTAYDHVGCFQMMRFLACSILEFVVFGYRE